MGGEILSSVVSLSVLLALLGAAAWVAKKLRTRLPAQEGGITLLSTRALGGQNTLVIAEAEGHRFLLGVSRTGITTLGRLND